MLQITARFKIVTLPASNLFPPFIALSSIGRPWQSQPVQRKGWSTCWFIPGTQCSLQPWELWNLKGENLRICLGWFFPYLPVISLRILLTAWPRWGDPLAYGGPSWRTYSDPLLQKASFMIMIDFWAKLPVFSLPCILLVQLALLKYFLVSCYSLFTLNFHGERCLWQEECAGILFWRLFLLLKLYVWAVQSSCSLPLQQCHQSTWAWQPSRPAGR